jgi:Flp pilus assembly protein TadG
MIKFKATAGMTNLKNIKQCGSGQAVLETVLILPFLLLLLLITVEIGRAIYIKIAVSNAARAGVQYGAQSQATVSDNAGIIQKARDDAGTNPSLLSEMIVTPLHFCECSNSPGTTVPCTSTCTSGRLIEFVQVDTTVTFSSLFHYPGLPYSFTMNGKAIMRVGGY